MSTRVTNQNPASRARVKSAAWPMSQPGGGLIARNILDGRAVLKDGRVRSLRLLPLPPGYGVGEVVVEYFNWLGRFLGPLLRCRTRVDGTVRLSVVNDCCHLLDFSPAETIHASRRRCYRLSGGWLVRRGWAGSGRVEFREQRARGQILMVIKDYKPALPWVLYQPIQSRFHVWVMKMFARHLATIPQRK